MSTKKANLILTTCSMAWGTSYIFMKLGIEGLSPLMLMALRTGIAFLILVLIFFKRLLNVNKRLLLYSAIPETSGASCQAWNHYRIDRNGTDQRR